MRPTVLLLAAALWVATTAAAQADPISVFVLTAIGGFAAVTPMAVAITTAILSTLLGVGLQVLSSLLLRKRPGGDVGGTTGKLQTGGTVPRAFPIGRSVVSHSLVYANTFGQDGKTPNAYLVQVLALSDLPVDGLAELWVNGSKVTWNPSATPATEGIAIPEFNKDGKDHLWVRFYDGSQTTADSRLVSLFAGDTNRPYGAGRIGTGVAYAVVTARLNRDLFGGFPTLKFVLDGVPLYDPREDSSVGGDGSQDIDNPATWSVAPANPMVVAYNILRGIRYQGEWFFGAQTVSAAQVPFASWNAAMNECDVEIDLGVGGTESQFTIGGEIRLDMTPSDVIEKLLIACNGRMGEVGGVYKPHVGAATSAVFSITDDDILSTEPQTFEPFKNLAEQVNAVTAKYIEPGEGWQAKDAPPLYNSALETEDGGRRQIADVPYDFVTSGTQVQRLMKAALNEHRRERSHTLPLAPDAFVLEPTVDFISWSSIRNGYSNKLFRVDAVQDQENLNLIVSLTEVDPSDYDWDEDTDEQPIIISPTPLVYPPAQAIDDWDAEPIRLTTASGLDKAAIRLLWDGTDIDDVIGVEFQVWDNGLTEIIYEGTTAPSTVPLGEVVISANIVSATTYKVRGRFVPGSGRPVSWSGYIAVTTPTILVPRNSLDGPYSDLMRRINERLVQIEGSLEDIGSAIQSLDSVQVDDARSTLQRVERLRAVTGDALAEIRDIRVVETTLINALAALGIDVEAALGTESAAGFLRIAASVDGGGALAALLLGVSTTRDGVSKTAAMEMAASGANTIIRFIADQTRFKANDGSDFAVFDGATKTLYIERIASGTTRKFKTLNRSKPGSFSQVGTGTIVTSVGNSFARTATIGSITVDANPDAIIGLSGVPDAMGVISQATLYVESSATADYWFGNIEAQIVAVKGATTVVVVPPFAIPSYIITTIGGIPAYAHKEFGYNSTGFAQLTAGIWDLYIEHRIGTVNYGPTYAPTVYQAKIYGNVFAEWSRV